MSQNMQKRAPEATWRPGAPEPGDLYLQNQKLCVCIDKSQLLLEITYTVSLKIKPPIHVYANVSELPPPPFYTPDMTVLTGAMVKPMSSSDSKG